MKTVSGEVVGVSFQPGHVDGGVLTLRVESKRDYSAEGYEYEDVYLIPDPGAVTADGVPLAGEALLAWLSSHRCRVTARPRADRYGASTAAAFTSAPPAERSILAGLDGGREAVARAKALAEPPTPPVDHAWVVAIAASLLLVLIGRATVPGHGLSWPGSYEAIAHLWAGALGLAAFAFWRRTEGKVCAAALFVATAIETIAFFARPSP